MPQRIQRQKEICIMRFLLELEQFHIIHVHSVCLSEEKSTDVALSNSNSSMQDPDQSFVLSEIYVLVGRSLQEHFGFLLNAWVGKPGKHAIDALRYRSPPSLPDTVDGVSWMTKRKQTQQFLADDCERLMRNCRFLLIFCVKVLRCLQRTF